MVGRYDTGGGVVLTSSPATLTVLGSSGAASPDRRSTAFLVGGELAVDGGALASGMPLHAQRRVRTVLLTHRHFDHLRELPLFLDNVYAARVPPVAIGAEEGTLEALRRHVFNGELWPDLSGFRRPPAEFFSLEAGRSFTRQGLRITPFRMHHSVPTVGFIFRRGNPGNRTTRPAAAAILGDTGYREEVFLELEAVEGLDLLVIEVSYPSRMEELAHRALHLTPALLQRGLRLVRRTHPRVRVLVTHLKPPWAAQTERELRRLRPAVRVARDGARLKLFRAP